MMRIRFSGAATPAVPADDWMTRTFYRPGEKLFTAPDRIKNAVDQFAARQAGKTPLHRMIAVLFKQMGGFLRKMVSYDFSVVHDMSLGKLKTVIAEPPIGSLILLLYPFTIIPRLYKAWDRGRKNNNDFREVGDVLRRDMMTITIFLFMLQPLLLVLNKIKQKMDGLRLVNRDKEHQAVLTYSQFKNYRIDSADVLKAMLREGNAKGLQKAIGTLSDHGLSAVGKPLLKQELNEIQQQMPALIQAFNRGNGLEVDRLSKVIYGHVEKAESYRNALLAEVEKGGTPELLNAARKLQGEVKDVVVQYANTRRLPLDMLGFAVVIGAIGYFPVWFNSMLNRKKFEEEQAAQRAATAVLHTPQLAQQTYQALKSTSRLSGNFNHGV